jgi:hypothetical protein
MLGLSAARATWRRLGFLAGLLGSIAASGCSGTSTGGGTTSGECADLSGTWDVTGTCGPDTCVVTQQGCSTSLVCGGGAGSYTGSISGSDASYSGHASDGTPATCEVSVSGGSFSGTCTPQGASQCTVDGARH